MTIWRQEECGYQNTLIKYVAILCTTPVPWHMGQMTQSRGGRIRFWCRLGSSPSPLVEMILDVVQALGISPPEHSSCCGYLQHSQVPLAEGLSWEHLPSNELLQIIFCFVVPWLKLMSCFFGHFWTCLHSWSRCVADYASFTSTAAKSRLKLTGLY